MLRSSWSRQIVFSSLLLAVLTSEASAQPGTVLSYAKIGAFAGDFVGPLSSNDSFGSAVSSLGDLNGDGVTDIVVGAEDDDDAGFNRGAVYVLLLRPNGFVLSQQKISDHEGNFGGSLDNSDNFGTSVTAVGDLNGDDVIDIAVGAEGDDDGGDGRGAVWILFLNSDGTVQSYQKVSDTEGGFGGVLDDGDSFGSAVAGLGDLDGDGVPDLVVGAEFDGDGGFGTGCLWVLFLQTDGTVKSYQKISATQGNFSGGIGFGGDGFGNSVTALGDLDGDAVVDLAVGALYGDDGGTSRGEVWMLFLNPDGTVKTHQKISDLEGGFEGLLDDFDFFGKSVAALGDVDGDGIGDLAVGAYQDDDDGSNVGAVWILFLNCGGTVKAHQKISDLEGEFTGTLDVGDWFGYSAAALGDFNGDGVNDVVVGAIGDDGQAVLMNSGAVWLLFLDGLTGPECTGDLTADNQVDAADLAILLGAWGPNPGHPADLDGSGAVEAADLATLLGAWGTCSICEISGPLGSCCAPGTAAGCNQIACNDAVCDLDPSCCTVSWDLSCAQLAVITCDNLCLPVSLATGDDPEIDGYLRVGADSFGSWASTSFGGAGDEHNPAGDLEPREVSFTNGFMVFDHVHDGRELLSEVSTWQNLISDSSLETEVTAGYVVLDTDENETPDTGYSSFRIFSGDGLVDVSVDLVQHIEADSPGIATLTQDYTLTNNAADTAVLEWVRVVDADLLWDGSQDYANDSVGTATNGSLLDRFVYQQEIGQSSTAVTISSPQGAAYYGGKRGIMPEGGPPAYDYGTDVQVWDAHGVPASWENHIAAVGYDTNGESGGAPSGCTSPCDAFIGLQIPVQLDSAETVTITVRHTYGATTPGGE